MMVVVVAQRGDRGLALETLERHGLTNPEFREQAMREIMFISPGSPGVRGMTFKPDDVYFLEGWDRNLSPEMSWEMTAILNEAGAFSDECGTLPL